MASCRIRDFPKEADSGLNISTETVIDSWGGNSCREGVLVIEPKFG